MENLKKRIEDLKKRENEQNSWLIVNAGLLKAGKSSLFNAIAGKDVFETDVVRATIQNKKVELDNYALLDTPGLDACEADDITAFSGYLDADLILFVHNLLEGEFNQIEVDAVNQMKQLFDSQEKFFENVILVLTCRDQKEEYKNLKIQIDTQCEKVFGYHFQKIFCVDSIGYLKGKREEKLLLVQDSGIEELMDEIRNRIQGESELQRSRRNKEKQEIIHEIEIRLEELERKKGEYNLEKTNGLDGLLSQIQTIEEETIEAVKNIKVDLPKESSYKWVATGKNYKDYSSESAARSAGREAIESAINKIAHKAKESATYVISNAENYITPSGVPTEIRNKMADSYERIREVVKKQNISVKQNFNIEIKTLDTKSGYHEMDYARDRARYIDKDSFSSVRHYETEYSANFYIDCDYTTEWVDGLFGGREKQKKVYQYDAQGAIDDVGDDGANIVNEIIDLIQPVISKEFSKIKEDMISQFRGLVKAIKGDLEQNIKKIKEKNDLKQKERKEIERTIDELLGLKNSL